MDEEGDTRWVWDRAAHGIGRLAEVESPAGHRETYRYDRYSRPETTELSLDGERFAWSVRYDPLGRPARLLYPEAEGERFSVTRDFDAHGHLVRVRGDRTSVAYWELRDTDVSGRIQTESFGNGVTTARRYSFTKNRTEGILTRQGATVLQRLSYGYDDRLNMTSRTDERQGKRERFEHDKLDRLVCATFEPGLACPQPIEYEPNGNLLRKPGLGRYTYDPDHPHAVQSVGGSGGLRYAYDAVGHPIARPGATVEDTAFDLPERHTLDSGAGVGAAPVIPWCRAHHSMVPRPSFI